MFPGLFHNSLTLAKLDTTGNIKSEHYWIAIKAYSLLFTNTVIEEVKMRCYFYGSVGGEDQLVRQAGTVSFAVPDIGVIFRSRWSGNLLECQYAALLSLLRFIETNAKLFKDKNIDILTDASVIVYQLSKDTFIFKNIEPYYRLVQTYKSKFPFSLHWIPQKENPANHGLNETPPLKPSVEINYDIKGDNKDANRRGGVLPL